MRQHSGAPEPKRTTRHIFPVYEDDKSSGNDYSGHQVYFPSYTATAVHTRGPTIVRRAN